MKKNSEKIIFLEKIIKFRNLRKLEKIHVCSQIPMPRFGGKICNAYRGRKCRTSAHKFQCRDLATKNSIFAEIKTSPKLRIFGEFFNFVQKIKLQLLLLLDFFCGVFFSRDFFSRDFWKKIRGKLRKTLPFFSRDFRKKI